MKRAPKSHRPTPAPPPPLSRDRVCAVCNANFGVDGPLPYECDLHVTAIGIKLTCSKACRARAGFADRKS